MLIELMKDLITASRNGEEALIMRVSELSSSEFEEIFNNLDVYTSVITDGKSLDDSLRTQLKLTENENEKLPFLKNFYLSVNEIAKDKVLIEQLKNLMDKLLSSRHSVQDRTLRTSMTSLAMLVLAISTKTSEFKTRQIGSAILSADVQPEKFLREKFLKTPKQISKPEPISAGSSPAIQPSDTYNNNNQVVETNDSMTKMLEQIQVKLKNLELTVEQQGATIERLERELKFLKSQHNPEQSKQIAPRPKSPSLF